MENKLKPCPFCGGEAMLYAVPEGGICVICWRCRSQTRTLVDDIMFTKSTSATNSVIKAWNRRIGNE